MIELLGLKVDRAVDLNGLAVNGSLTSYLGGNGDLFPVTEPHATQLKIPHTLTIFRRAHEVNQNLTQEQFVGRREALIERLDDLPKVGIEAAAEKLAIWRGLQPRIVIELQPSPQLRASQLVLYCIMVDFLRGCGIADVRNFMRRIHGLQYLDPNVYQPHVSIARGPGIRSLCEEPVHGAPIHLGPPRIAEVVGK